jgi:hypothetical protein
VLGSANGPSSLAASMSMAVELLEGQIDAVAANRVCWRSHSPLATAVSHFLELKTELHVLGSRRSADLTEHGQIPSGSRCVQSRIRLHRMFLPRVPITLLLCKYEGSG